MTFPAPRDQRSPPIKYTSLARLMSRVQAVLAPAIDRSFGLRAELGAADERDGVFYGELIESNGQGKLIAKLRCVIWSEDLRRIRARFAREGLELGLQRGSVIGVECVLQFHPVHGLCVRVLDMDPAFVIGEIELRRRRTLAMLEREGLLGRNAALRVPLIPNRIVLITSASSAACQDFVRTVHERRFGARVWLADATMQGPETEASMLRALKVAEQLAPDLVVVIRGGGSKTDLSWLDSVAIARCIATLNRPVWTGIGHETDHSVLDAVAGQAFRTPTAVAEALAARLERVSARLDEMGARLRDVFLRAESAERERLREHATRVTQAPKQVIAQHRLRLAADGHQLQRSAQARIALARTSWAAAASGVQRRCQLRLSSAQRALQSLQGGWSAATLRDLQRRRSALEALMQRLEPRRLSERLGAARMGLTQHQQALRRSSLAHIASTRAKTAGAATVLRTRLAARVAAARLALSPHAHLLRRALEARVRTAAGRVHAQQAHLRLVALQGLERQQYNLERVRDRLTLDRVVACIARERHALQQRELLVRAHDPRRLLARGYSLTYNASGQLVRSVRELAAADVFTTQLADGCILGAVRAIQQEEDDE